MSHLKHAWYSAMATESRESTACSTVSGLKISSPRNVMLFCVKESFNWYKSTCNKFDRFSNTKNRDI